MAPRNRLLVRQPRQQRSQDLLDRMVSAARDLLGERDFETVSIADIAARAGVSVGVLYTRFPTKDHLLVHLASEFARDGEALMLRTFDESRVADLSLAELAELYFTMSATSFARHRRLLRSVSLLVRTTEHAELRRIVAGFNAKVHARFAAAVLAHRRTIRHPDPDVAVGFAILAGSATLREMVLYEEPVSNLARGHKRAALEVARMFTTYLTCAISR